MGPYEHHSNLLPWREAGAVVCRVRETSEGLVDLGHLENELQVNDIHKYTKNMGSHSTREICGNLFKIRGVSKYGES